MLWFLPVTVYSWSTRALARAEVIQPRTSHPALDVGSTILFDHLKATWSLLNITNIGSSLTNEQGSTRKLLVSSRMLLNCMRSLPPQASPCTAARSVAESSAILLHFSQVQICATHANTLVQRSWSPSNPTRIKSRPRAQGVVRVLRMNLGGGSR